VDAETSKGTKTCPSCQAEIPSEDRVCVQCGFDFNRSEPHAENGQSIVPLGTPPPRPDVQRLSRLAVVGFVVVIVATAMTIPVALWLFTQGLHA
jgi:hypothetical protein